MQMDTLADALTVILNAEKTGKKTVTVKPASKIIANVLRTIQRAGYLGELEFFTLGKKAEVSYRKPNI